MYKYLILFFINFLALKLNCADQVSVNSLPYVIFRDIGKNSNGGSNEYMQDRSCAIIKEDNAFFGIFDGHGTIEDGHLIPEFLSNNLYKHVINHDIKSGFKLMDEELTSYFGKNLLKTHGSTASVALIKNNGINIGHIGDSKIVLIRDGKVIVLTKDHKPNPNENNAEYVRVKNLVLQDGDLDIDDIIQKVGNGWYLTCGSKLLGMTRSFGDISGKPYVTCEPEIIKLDMNDDDEFLVLASDGLWDAIDPSLLVDYLQSKKEFTEEAQDLFNAAIERWSTSQNGSDNIEIIVVNLKLLYKNLINESKN